MDTTKTMCSKEIRVHARHVSSILLVNSQHYHGHTYDHLNEHKNPHFDNEYDNHTSSETHEESGYGLNLL